jgi:F0F1-type ATP synthase membrane subunit c/vacuolar-type H+-ATPase subunit K
MITLLFVVPGLVAAYFLFFRSVLKAVPALKEFYSRADGFWAKVWALCGNSITLLWSYFLAALGALSAAVGDPAIMGHITGALKDHPEYLSYVLMGISAVTIATRLRSIGKG